MAEYCHVTWEAYIQAASPRAAAESAMAGMRDKYAHAKVFHLTDEAGKTTRVDLEETEDA